MNVVVESIGDVMPFEDYSQMNLVVSNTAGIVSGDRFTIDTLNAFSALCEDTGKLRAFTVLDIIDANNIVITPPIKPVSESPIANVTQGITGGESITFLTADEMRAKLSRIACK